MEKRGEGEAHGSRVAVVHAYSALDRDGRSSDLPDHPVGDLSNSLWVLPRKVEGGYYFSGAERAARGREGIGDKIKTEKLVTS